MEWLEAFNGRQTKFRAWARELAKRRTRDKLAEFRAATLDDGAWTLTINTTTPPNERPTIQTPLKAGDRLNVVYVTKRDIITSAIDEQVRGGSGYRDCGIDAKPKIAPRFCALNVRKGDNFTPRGKGVGIRKIRS